MTQALFRAEGDVRVQFVLLGLLRRLAVRRGRRAHGERVGETVVALGRRQAVADFRQQQRAQFAFPIRVAPEQIEGGVEEFAFVGRADQQRGERGAHVVAAAEIDPVQRGERIDGLGWRHRQARAAQHAHEVHDVARECGRFVGACRCGFIGRGGLARMLSDCSSSRVDAMSCRYSRRGSETLRDLRGIHARQIVLILEQHAQRVLHRLRIEFRHR